MNKPTRKVKPGDKPAAPARPQPAAQLRQQVTELTKQLHEVSQQLQQAQESEKRALADYQNLVRRTQQDKSKLVKLMNQEIILALLQPLHHLELAAAQLQDPGLNMVVNQVWQTLAQFGLEEIKVQGQPFNLETMEVVEKQDEGEKVVKVVQKGYRLNGEVIQHAKVIIG